MSELAASAIVTTTHGGFPYLSHRTVAEIPGECADGLFCTLDRVSSVPILHGFGTPDCTDFRFIISGAQR
jgi:hypothetical protein